MGKSCVAEMQFHTDQKYLQVLINQVQEFLTLLGNKDIQLPPLDFPDVKEQINLLGLQRTVIEIDGFMLLRSFLRTWADWLRLLRHQEENCPDLHDLSISFPYDKNILASIISVLEEKGEIRREISPELNRIKDDIKKVRKIQDRKFEGLLRSCREKGWLSDEEQTVRNERRVLALLSEHKRKIKGIIHDESGTGKTTFLEPQNLVELGNDLFELRQKERKEIRRILLELTNEIRPFQDHLVAYRELAGFLDFSAAKARLAIQMDAAVPFISKKGDLKLKKARHPLLLMAFKEQNREVVPLEIRLNSENHIVIISGPNAGGKSICLKTIGLIQLMFQAGMMVPLEKGSRLPVFGKFFLDMGDDQSLENDLSTYSSHLRNLKEFMMEADANSLFLLDEFGTGTDPQFGGAIAEGVLEQLKRKKAFGVATTHYTNLKLYAENRKGVENASMMFDQAKMKPTFRLQMGKPGSSYAMEIAERIGLGKEVLDYASSQLGEDAEAYDQLIMRLEKDKLALERKLKAAQDKETRYHELMRDYKLLKSDFRQRKEKWALDYKTQLANELKNANKRFEKELARLKKSGKNQDDVAREIREGLTKKKDRVNEELSRLEERRKAGKPKEDIKEGDYVKMEGGQESGKVVEISRNKALVAFGNLRTRVSLDKLEKASKKEARKGTKGVNLQNYIAEFDPTLDLRGKRADEALDTLEKRLDQGVVLNQKLLRVIHGKGDGVLRSRIVEYLGGRGDISGFDHEHPDLGGDGVTLISI